MAGNVAIISVARPAARRRPLLRGVLLAFVLLLPLLASGSQDSRPPLQRGLERATREERFSLVGWEVDALAERALRPLNVGWTPGRDPGADREAVLRFVRLSGELGQIAGERDRFAATSRDAAQSLALDRRAFTLADERATLRPIVESVIAWQLEQILVEQGIRRGIFYLRGRPDFPFVDPRFVPPVAFRLGETPKLLIVARRDRIQLVDSVLLDASLTFREIDALEAETDRLGVSSLVTSIGGLAAYPSMLPASSSLTWTLQTVAHEWLHHYFAFRPLGLGYFGSYEMRTINETAADLAGEELARLVHARYYSPPMDPWPAPTGVVAARPATTTPQPTFTNLMREIRREVEAMLARGNVAGAEAYMAEQQAELARRGYYVRRLNTAYLSFFGAYSGGANPYEERLRALRASSASLAEYLEVVSGVSSASDLIRLEAIRLEARGG